MGKKTTSTKKAQKITEAITYAIEKACEADKPSPSIKKPLQGPKNKKNDSKTPKKADSIQCLVIAKKAKKKAKKLIKVPQNAQNATENAVTVQEVECLAIITEATLNIQKHTKATKNVSRKTKRAAKLQHLQIGKTTRNKTKEAVKTKANVSKGKEDVSKPLKATNKAPGKATNNKTPLIDPGECSKRLGEELYVLLKLVDKFQYQLAIKTTDVKEGLLHTFLRHANQWDKVLPGLDLLTQSIPWLKPVLEATQGDPTKARPGLAAARLIFDLSTNEEKIAMHEYMLKILVYLCNNVSSKTFRAKHCLEKGKAKYYFEVLLKPGTCRYLVICCLAKQLADKPKQGKPLKIITAYFANKTCSVIRPSPVL